MLNFGGVAFSILAILLHMMNPMNPRVAGHVNRKVVMDAWMISQSIIWSSFTTRENWCISSQHSGYQQGRILFNGNGFLAHKLNRSISWLQQRCTTRSGWNLMHWRKKTGDYVLLCWLWLWPSFRGHSFNTTPKKTWKFHQLPTKDSLWHCDGGNNASKSMNKKPTDSILNSPWSPWHSHGFQGTSEAVAATTVVYFKQSWWLLGK